MKKKLLDYFHSPPYQAQTLDEILSSLGMEGKKQEITDALNKLINDYEVVLSKKGRYILARDAGIHIGHISIKNPDFGFISSAAYNHDFYVSKNNFNGAFDKDKVAFQIKQNSHLSRHNEEAYVIGIVTRGLRFVIGELRKYKKNYFIDFKNPLCERLVIKKPVPYTVGDIVKAEITNYYSGPEGKIVELIGHKNDIDVDILTIAAELNFTPKFTKEATEDLRTLPLDINTEAKVRKKPAIATIITIDGADAKDLDDAVGILKKPNGNFLLGVYIADVSYYIKEGSALDEEALDRGTSVYLINRVIPMLPPLISNDLCSLNPGSEKLVIACEMEINKSGEVVNREIFPSVIKAKYRMTYDTVNEIIKGNEEISSTYRGLAADILLMNELKETLYTMRKKRGALAFDVDEGKVIVTEEGKPLDVILLKRGESERIIEEFMLIANETIASTIFHLELPFIYRVHDEPDSFKFETFRKLIGNMGYGIFKHRVNAGQIQEFLDALPDKESFLKILLLRAMSKAIYSEKNIGHFGLGSKCYTHFTAPIRRYPDLLVHRLLRKYLFYQNINPDESTELSQKIAEIASISSKRERDAMECEYRVEDMKKAEYMADFIGERFSGIVASVTKFGLFVMLPNTVEGFVHINTLRGYYQYDPNTMKLIGPGENYSLGSKVLVEVIKADKKSREIDFKIVYNKVKQNGKHHRQKQKSNL